MLLLWVQGPHSENHCSRQREKHVQRVEVEVPMNQRMNEQAWSCFCYDGIGSTKIKLLLYPTDKVMYTGSEADNHVNHTIGRTALTWSPNSMDKAQGQCRGEAQVHL